VGLSEVSSGSFPVSSAAGGPHLQRVSIERVAREQKMGAPGLAL
jgi:uncharacterized protein (DUF2249 family)